MTSKKICFFMKRVNHKVNKTRQKSQWNKSIKILEWYYFYAYSCLSGLATGFRGRLATFILRIGCSHLLPYSLYMEKKLKLTESWSLLLYFAAFPSLSKPDVFNRFSRFQQRVVCVFLWARVCWPMAIPLLLSPIMYSRDVDSNFEPTELP